MSDRVTINCGGRHFETSTTTLQASGSHYFAALFGTTGTTMRGGSRKKRRRRDADVDGKEEEGEAGEEGEGDEAFHFLDRDPDLFGSLATFAAATLPPPPPPPLPPPRYTTTTTTAAAAAAAATVSRVPPVHTQCSSSCRRSCEHGSSLLDDILGEAEFLGIETLPQV